MKGHRKTIRHLTAEARALRALSAHIVLLTDLHQKRSANLLEKIERHLGELRGKPEERARGAS